MGSGLARSLCIKSSARRVFIKSNDSISITQPKAAANHITYFAHSTPNLQRRPLMTRIRNIYRAPRSPARTLGVILGGTAFVLSPFAYAMAGNDRTYQHLPHRPSQNRRNFSESRIEINRSPESTLPPVSSPAQSSNISLRINGQQIDIPPDGNYQTTVVGKDSTSNISVKIESHSSSTSESNVSHSVNISEEEDM